MAGDVSPVTDYQAFPVLYVDDEVGNLRTFELTFRREFSVICATDGSEALNVLATQPVAVVLSDHRMPGMTGTELLSRVREVAPRTVRLLVTAFGDASTLAQAINAGSIYRYIPKPWVADEMREIVRQAIDLFALEEHRQRLVAELRALHEASRDLAGKLETGSLIRAAVETVVTEFGFDGATLLLMSEDGQTLRVAACHPRVHDAEDSIASLKLSLHADGTLEPLRRGESVWLDATRAFDSSKDVRAFSSAMAADEMLFVPLEGRRGLVGSLVVDNRRGGSGFGGSEQQVLRSLAAQIGIAVDNAQLVGQLRNEAAQCGSADFLAISGALSVSMAREVEAPLNSLADACKSLPTMRSLSDVATAVGVFTEILEEQTPAPCDIGERIRRVIGLAGGLAASRSVDLSVGQGGFSKRSLLPGRLLQLLLHLLELAIEAGAGGAVGVYAPTGESSALVEVTISAATKPELESVADGGESEALRIAACEGLARELGLAIELTPERRPSVWRLSVAT